MSAMDEPLTKAEKLNVRQDQSLRDQQRRQGGTTYFERAQLDAALEHQGRFRDVTAATVVGASPGAPNHLWTVGKIICAASVTPVSLSVGDEVPNILSRLRPGEFLITSAKRLFATQSARRRHPLGFPCDVQRLASWGESD